ncbi:hypothetical protein, partial [Lactobacillus delbrueckii]
GGIGRRAAFRSLFWQQSEGSTPLVGMTRASRKNACFFYFLFSISSLFFRSKKSSRNPGALLL